MSEEPIRIIIEVYNGLVSEVYTDRADVEIVFRSVDQDCEGADPKDISNVEDYGEFLMSFTQSPSVNKELVDKIFDIPWGL